MSELDAIDRRILRILQEDGRVTTVDLADRIGLSPTATSERVKRLFRERFVTGFRAMLDPVKLDRGLLVFVEVGLDKTTPDVFERFAEAVKRSPEVLECHMVAAASTTSSRHGWPTWRPTGTSSAKSCCPCPA